jgi:phenylalanyl-tRNA synthetase beta chain
VLREPGLAPGDDLVRALDLDDEVLDIEVEPNRPDFLSVRGLAREVASLTGTPLVDPAPPLDEDASELAAEVATIRIDAIDGCPRYVARVIRGVGAGETPIAAQARLTASGMRPVSPVVDATNYAMLELGQPLHAFDLHRLAGPGIVVRRAAEGEPLRTLDDVDRVMRDGDLLICDAERPVAIAGIMGGATSEVADDTADVLLESAWFTRTGVLRTARRLDLHTEASHRFERGTDPEGLEDGAARGAQLITAWAGGRVATGVTDDGATPPRRWVAMRPARASSLLAYEVSDADAAGAFDRLAFTHRPGSVDGADAIEVEVPGYRVDVEREVDLIEEVARVLGYDRIGSHVPSTGRAGGEPAGYRFRGRVVDGLVRAGLREVRLLTFASADDLAATGDADAVPVTNPLQVDEGFLRTRLLPGLVRAATRNRARGVSSVSIFEAGTVFRLAGDRVEERQHAAFVLTGPAEERWFADDRPFDALDASGIVTALLAELGVPPWEPGPPAGPPFHPGRSATVVVDGTEVGVVGELHPRIARAADIDERLAGGELVLDDLIGRSVSLATVREAPRFPPVRRDLAFVVPEGASAGEVQRAIEQASAPLATRVVLFDVFRGPPLEDGMKSLAFAVELRADDRTLTGEESEPVVGAIVEAVTTGFDGRLRTG